MAKKKTEDTPVSAAKKAGLTTRQISFARSLQISECLMYGRSSQDEHLRVPIPVFKTGVRGQSSHDMSMSEMAKKNQNPGKSNPQIVHKAILPSEADQLEISWNARIIPQVMAPFGCDNSDVFKAYKCVTDLYNKAGGFEYLAQLYLWNIANARFTWRNRWLSDDAKVTLNFDSTEIVFDPFLVSLKKYNGIDEIKAAVTSGNPDAVDVIVARMAKAFVGEPVTLKCMYLGKVEHMTEVFPSQEYMKDDHGWDLKDVRRVYSSVKTRYGDKVVNQASIHSQKINNALRCFDIWHGNLEHGPVAINAFAGDQVSSEVLRMPKSGKSLYDIMRKSDEIFDTLEAGGVNDEIHFFVANLARGGVFAAS